MRGFLKVCYFLYFEQRNSGEDDYKHAPQSSEKQHNVYIRKADVLQVIKLENFKQLRKWCNQHDHYHRKECCSFAALQLIHFGKEIVCSCGVAEIWSKLKRDCQEEKTISCSCVAHDTFPMYIVRCKNKIETSYADIDRNEELVLIPKVANYIVDASEREHMERFLAGTDDPLYDYVHLLQYGPNGGTEVNKAREEFESAAKKQKTLTNA
jgi:hypothetical protein